MKTIGSYRQRPESAAPPEPSPAAPSLSHVLGNVIDQLSSINLYCYQFRSVLPTAKRMDLVRELDRLETAVLETIVLVEKLALGIHNGPSASSPPSRCNYLSAQTAEKVYPFSLNLKRELEGDDSASRQS